MSLKNPGYLGELYPHKIYREIVCTCVEAFMSLILEDLLDIFINQEEFLHYRESKNINLYDIPYSKPLLTRALSNIVTTLQQSYP